MQIVTLAEVKERLNIDFNTADNDIIGLVNGIEGYLIAGTGICPQMFKHDSIVPITPLHSVAKEYVLFTAYCDYYHNWTELDRNRQKEMINQLKVGALVAEYAKQS